MFKTSVIFSLLILAVSSKAQQVMNCGVSPKETLSNYQDDEGAADPCFDIQAVMNSCEPIKIKMYFHYFLDDNCSGNLAGVNIPLSQMAEVTDSLIAEGNEIWLGAANNAICNPEAHNTPVTAPQCIPIEYSLQGISYHCDSKVLSVNSGIYDSLEMYAVNPNEYINILICKGKYYYKIL